MGDVANNPSAKKLADDLVNLVPEGLPDVVMKTMAGCVSAGWLSGATWILERLRDGATLSGMAVEIGDVTRKVKDLPL